MAEGLYYSESEYVLEFGEEEAIRLTDEDALGAVDSNKMDAAIERASAEIDAYLAKRYQLPLASTPREVEEIAAALVRERLHSIFPTDSVTAAAKLARQRLRDLATGVAVLVDATGAQPDTQVLGPDGITTSAPARVFTAAKRGRFASLT